MQEVTSMDEWTDKGSNFPSVRFQYSGHWRHNVEGLSNTFGRENEGQGCVWCAVRLVCCVVVKLALHNVFSSGFTPCLLGRDGGPKSTLKTHSIQLFGSSQYYSIQLFGKLRQRFQFDSKSYSGLYRQEVLLQWRRSMSKRYRRVTDTHQDTAHQTSGANNTTQCIVNETTGGDRRK